MTSEDVVKRIAAEGVFVDERRGVGIRLNPRDAPMLQAFLVRSALLIVAATLGGFGIFCVIYSFDAPRLTVQEVILLCAALAIVYFTDR